MLRAAEIGAMQHAALLSFADTCTISRKNPVGDGMGGDADNYLTVVQPGNSQTSPCRLESVQRRLPSEAKHAEMPTTITLYNIHLPASAIVKRDDRITLKGSVYHVMDTDGNATEAIDTLATCERIS